MAHPHMQAAFPSSTANDRPWARRRRKVHHKVKTGCAACKARRQKCDEQKPICAACSRYSTECCYPAASQHGARAEAVTSLAEATQDSLAVASPSKRLPVLPPSSALNLGDLELLHQFMTSTCIGAGQLPEITAYMQVNILPLAQAHPFVMHGVLAMAATHLAWLRPARQAHYAAVAAQNHCCALADFQAALRHIDQSNCHAVISYAKSLLWCSFADEDAAGPGDGNWLPQWFRLLHGSCHVVESSRAWITDGPHVVPALDRDEDYAENADVRQVEVLKAQLLGMVDEASCRPVLDALEEAFARASMHQHNVPLRLGINSWVASLSDDYIARLKKREPWAMVAFAHFCVLVHRLETTFFMKGHAARLVRAIYADLDTPWRSLMQWPCREVATCSYARSGHLLADPQSAL